ncbi:MAG: hypothetical protein WC648_05170 [Candidatus Paceibacterota bacterium]|jgi:hypothetical protein
MAQKTDLQKLEEFADRINIENELCDDNRVSVIYSTYSSAYIITDMTEKGIYKSFEKAMTRLEDIYNSY